MTALLFSLLLLGICGINCRPADNKDHVKDFRPIEIRIDGQIPKVHKDCLAAYEAGWVRSGVYRISPDRLREMDVVCEQEEHGGGWVVVQRRLDGTVNFDRSWVEYATGFGNLDGELWMGNQNINVLTENREQSLRVELHYAGEGFYHVDCSSFSVGDKHSNFKLSLGRCTSEDNMAGDSLSYHNGQPFSTKDADHDNDCRSCAQVHRGGWWYDNCTTANLNGVYGGRAQSGMFWRSWRGFSNSLVSVRMLVRGDGDKGDKATTSTTREPTTGTIEATTQLETTLEPTPEPTTTPEPTPEPTTTPEPTPEPTTTLEPTPEPTTLPEPTTTPEPTTSTMTGKDCQEVYDNGGTTSGVYTISPGGTNIQVYCEQELQGGGWTVFQRRVDGSQDFYRGWADYKRGFGNPSSEYWVGNDQVHALTADGNQQLLVELQYGGQTAYAQYSTFVVKDATELYKLEVGGFTNGQNNPGDSLAYHNGQAFSTFDQDKDGWPGGSCAQDLSGAYWYNSCYHSHLNGLYGDNSGRGVTWSTWQHTTSLSATRMMLKPR